MLQGCQLLEGAIAHQSIVVQTGGWCFSRFPFVQTELAFSEINESNFNAQFQWGFIPIFAPSFEPKAHSGYFLLKYAFTLENLSARDIQILRPGCSSAATNSIWFDQIHNSNCVFDRKLLTANGVFLCWIRIACVFRLQWHFCCNKIVFVKQKFMYSKPAYLCCHPWDFDIPWLILIGLSNSATGHANGCSHVL